MAIKNSYTPFMKFKANEVAALFSLDPSLKKYLTPFFDFPRKNGMTRAQFESLVQSCRKKAEKYLAAFPYIYVDSFDIPDAIASAGHPNYGVVIEEFSTLKYVPVTGLDRTPDHNKAIFDAKKAGKISSNILAIRFQPDEFSSFDLIKEELGDLLAEGLDLFENLVFIFDCRVCLTINRKKFATEIANFIKASSSMTRISKHIVVGSSVPATITDIAKPSDESVIERAELEIFHHAEKLIGQRKISLGDYTIVSPKYSELTISPELLLSVTAPKVFYTYKNYHYIARGKRIKTNGYGQYDEICSEISQKSFYRGAPYSWGDEFIHLRANGFREKNVTPTTILKPTICAHITYMAMDYPK